MAIRTTSVSYLCLNDCRVIHVHTGRASSTPILDIRMNDLLKYLTAFAASSGLLYPTYPILRCGINFASVIVCFAAKCFLKSSSEMEGGSPLTKIREETIVLLALIGVLRLISRLCKIYGDGMFVCEEKFQRYLNNLKTYTKLVPSTPNIQVRARLQ